MNNSLHTTQMQLWVHRLQHGDRCAGEDLFRSIASQLERLGRKMLKNFPVVQRWAEVDDVLQNARIRLLRSLGEVEPRSMREFFGLASVLIRRELIDMARSLKGKEGIAEHYVSADFTDSSGNSVKNFDPAESTEPVNELEMWSSFHEEVGKLPLEEREVVGLIYYHNWTRQEVADLFGVNERTVRRWWNSAILKLSKVFQNSALA